MPRTTIRTPTPARPADVPRPSDRPHDISLWIDVRQRQRRIHRRALGHWTRAALERMEATAEVALHLVGEAEITRLNQEFLRHDGSTDIITFDHGSCRGHLHGELFISIPDAVAQSAEFGTTWQEELGRYVIHGLLHLQGEDDLEPEARRRMKRRENRLVRQTAAVVPVESLGSDR